MSLCGTKGIQIGKLSVGVRVSVSMGGLVGGGDVGYYFGVEEAFGEEFI